MKMPTLGMGTFRLQGDVAYQSVKLALAEGYRHIDTAQIYGNEAEVGQAIADSGLVRSEIFITTKVWLDNLTADKFIASVQHSLAKLQTDYVDLLLIHWPTGADGVPMATYLPLLAQAKQLGLTRQIGVSNFTIAQIDQAISLLGSGEIYTNQIEVHPYLQNRKVIAHNQANGIIVTGYMPLAVGKVFADPVLQRIATETGYSISQIVLSWVLSQGLVAIPSSTKQVNLADNFSAGNITLTPEHIAVIAQLEAGERIANPDFAPKWDE
ncbi:2,5-didehydrogluconate reductase DkgB [Chromatiaceae bacterium AAb-1]|nr:2,5-didehydrogluconate reductase DkgB [Chromatiaceae bacterium AAb-1]